MRIAVYTPALNEAKHAARWAAATVEADLRLVGDTGSEDDTVQILASAGVTVVPIWVRPWRFDVARNAALALIPDDIDLCVQLDMDEVCEPGFFDAVRQAWEERGPFHRGRILIHTGAWWRSPRVHSRFGYHWVFPGHELVLPYHGDLEVSVDIEARIRHLPDDSKSRSQYMGLLELGTIEQPHSFRMWCYLARERWYREDKAGILEAAEKAVEIDGWDVDYAAVCRWAAWAAPDATEARKWLLRGTEGGPAICEAWHALAFHCHATEDWEECLKAAQRGLGCPPGDHLYSDPEVLAWKLDDLVAISAWRLGDRTTAARHAVKALAANPSDERLRENAARMTSVSSPVERSATVIIPVWNRWDMTERCLDSLIQSVPRRDVMVVDNGSIDATSDQVEGYIHLPENVGFAAGCNVGAQNTESDVLVFLNNDTVCPVGWLDELLAAFDDPNVGAAGPRSNYVSGPQQLTVPGYSLDTLDAFAAAWRSANTGKFTPVTRLVGFCLAVRRDLFEKLGGFDESFGLGGYEDDDLCWRITEAGYRLVIAQGSFIHHDGHATFDGNGLDWYAEQQKAEKIFDAKYGEHR